MIFRHLHLTLAATAVAVSALLAGCGGGASAPTASSQSISFNPTATANLGTPVTLSATSTSGLAVTFSTSTSSVCTVSGNTLTLVSAGTCTVNADQSGNSAYAAATQVTRQITVSAAEVIVASGFGNGTTPNGGTWGNYAGWGQFQPASVNNDHQGFGGGGWQETPPLIENGYVYFGLTTASQITGGYAGLRVSPPAAITLNGQTSLSIPLAIGAEWANQTSNKSVDVIIQAAWNSAANCANKVKATVSTATATLTTFNIPLSQFTAVPENTCTQSAAQTLSGPIAEIHVQAVAPNFNTTVLSNSRYATGFTIGSPVKFR
jgi:hypothetical protein